jgi:hypothetical protein
MSLDDPRTQIYKVAYLNQRLKKFPKNANTLFSFFP